LHAVLAILAAASWNILAEASRGVPVGSPKSGQTNPSRRSPLRAIVAKRTQASALPKSRRTNLRPRGSSLHTIIGQTNPSVCRRQTLAKGTQACVPASISLAERGRRLRSRPNEPRLARGSGGFPVISLFFPVPALLFSTEVRVLRALLQILQLGRPPLQGFTGKVCGYVTESRRVMLIPPADAIARRIWP
jgi:hypothetical protein